MSFLARPTVVCAIVFGCFAVLIPRVFLPLFRTKSVPISHRVDDNFRRSSPPMARNDQDDTVEQLSDSPPHMRGAHPNMRMHHPGAVGQQQQPPTDQITSKSLVTFALPMYTVGIGIFFLYTCVKYWSKQNTEENKIKDRYSSNNIKWNAEKRKFKYDTNNRPVIDDEEGENEEDLYAGLDPDYVEYLKLKKRKELETEQALTAEQRQMHNALDEMKNSLSFISSKLVANETVGNLSNNDISQLQDRLATTESQMCKILQALDAASNKVNELTKNTRQSLEQPLKTEEEYRRSSGSASESEGSLNNEEENSNSEENSSHHEGQILINNKHEESSSSSYDEEEPNQIEDDESESEPSERYGTMSTNYECDPTTIEDYTLNPINKSDQPDNSQTKVREWHQRNHSQSLSSSNSSIEQQDQAIPNVEQNRLTKRKHK